MCLILNLHLKNGQNMKQIMTFIAVAAVSCSCAVTIKPLSVVEHTRTFEIPDDYTQLEISYAINVDYSSEASVMTVTADSLVMEYFEFEVRNGKMEIGIDDDAPVFNGGRISIILPKSSALTSISISGASHFAASETLASEDFHISLSGASGVRAYIDTRNLMVVVSGASHAGISGTAEVYEVMCSGASHISSKNAYISAEKASVTLSGASGAYLGCSEKLTGNVSGASHIYYSGDCRCDVGVRGASSADRM